MLKRCMGAFLSIAMVLSMLSGMVVFADGESTTSEIVKTISFDDITIPDGKELGDGIWNDGKAKGYAQATFRTDKGAIERSLDAGKFGKASDDKSVHMYHNTGTISDAGQFLYYNEVEDAHKSEVTGGPITSKGNFYEMEIYMAWSKDGASNNKLVAGYLNNDLSGTSLSNKDGKYGGWEGVVLKVSKQDNKIDEGSVIVFGNDTGVNLTENERWYKFNLVIHAGDKNAEQEADKNWYKLYIDNKLVKDQTVFDVNTRGTILDNFTGFKRYELTLNTGQTDTITDGVWFDDFTVKNNLATEPTYTDVLSETTDAAKKYNGLAYSGYVDKNTKFEHFEFVEGITAAYVTSDGTEATDFSADKTYVRLTNESGLKLYGLLKNESKKVYEKNFNDGTTVGSASVATASVVDGMAGKSSDDKVMKLATDNTSGTEATWPSLQIQNSAMSNAIDPTKPFTAEISVRVDGEYDSTIIEMCSKVNASDTKDTTYKLAYIYPNGTVKRGESSTDPVLTTFEPGEWVRIGISVFPELTEYNYTLTINGVDCGDYSFANAKGFTRLRYEQKISAGKKANLYLDDLCIYQGTKPTRSGVNLTSEEYSVNKDGVIFIDESADQNEFYSNITIPQNYETAVYGGFTNGDVVSKEEDAEVQEGDILVAYNKDECIYKYYYIAEGDEAPITVSKTVDESGNAIDWKTAGDKKVKFNLNCFKSLSKASIIVAEYDGETLVNVTVKDVTLNPTFTQGTRTTYGRPASVTTDAIDVNVKGANHTIKAFIFDGMTNIMPLAGVTTL